MLTEAWLADQETRAAYGSATLKYDIGAALVAARKRKNLTQAALAELAGVRESYIVALESGEANPPLSRVGAFFACLGVQCRLRLAPLLTPGPRTDTQKGEA